jgi:hypothetical protein
MNQESKKTGIHLSGDHEAKTSAGFARFMRDLSENPFDRLNPV